MLITQVDHTDPGVASMMSTEFHEIVQENLSIAKQHNSRLYHKLCDAYVRKDMDGILTISEALSDLLAQKDKASLGGASNF